MSEGALSVTYWCADGSRRKRPLVKVNNHSYSKDYMTQDGITRYRCTGRDKKRNCSAHVKEKDGKFRAGDIKHTCTRSLSDEVSSKDYDSGFTSTGEEQNSANPCTTSCSQQEKLSQPQPSLVTRAEQQPSTSKENKYPQIEPKESPVEPQPSLMTRAEQQPSTSKENKYLRIEPEKSPVEGGSGIMLKVGELRRSLFDETKSITARFHTFGKVELFPLIGSLLNFVGGPIPAADGPQVIDVTFSNKAQKCIASVPFEYVDKKPKRKKELNEKTIVSNEKKAKMAPSNRYTHQVSDREERNETQSLQSTDAGPSGTQRVSGPIIEAVAKPTASSVMSTEGTKAEIRNKVTDSVKAKSKSAVVILAKTSAEVGITVATKSETKATSSPKAVGTTDCAVKVIEAIDVHKSGHAKASGLREFLGDWIPEDVGTQTRDLDECFYGRAGSPEWKLGDCIGAGAFGKVYKCYYKRNFSHPCAVKVVKIEPHHAETRTEVDVLANEISILSKLEHRRILTYYGSEEKENILYLFMEFMHRGSLYNYIKKRKFLDECESRKFTRQMLEGVSFLHSVNVVHRDIKGSNVLIDIHGDIKLADFGLSKLIQKIGSKNNLVSHCGSPYWMAPEIFLGEGYGRKVDIWSVGCTVVEMLTGRPPLGHLEPQAAMFRIGSKPTEPTLPENLSQDGRDFIKATLTWDPEERPWADELLRHRFFSKKRGVTDLDTSLSPSERRRLDRDPEKPSRWDE